MVNGLGLTAKLRTAAALLLLSSVAGCGGPRDAQGGGGKPAAPKLESDSSEPQTRPPSDTADWPVYRGNQSGTGVSDSNLAESLDVAWKFTPGGTIFEATAAIVGDTVYVGDGDSTLYALDLSNGRPRWTFPGDHGFLAAPAVRDGRVYIGDSSGVFHCVDAAGGKEIWKFSTGLEINSSANFFEDSVLFGSQDGWLYRLRCKDGSLVWKYSISTDSSMPVDGGIQSSPTLAGSLAFFAACDGKLHIVDVTNGKNKGVLDIDAPTLSTPAILGNFVYVGTMAGDYFAVAWKKPEIVWAYRNPQSGTDYRSSPAAVGDWVLIAARNKMMEGLRRSDGALQWTYATGARVESSPVVVGSRVFFGSADGRLYCVDLTTGKLKWNCDAGGSFTAAPAVGRNRLVIGNHNGTLYCFGPKKTK